ncbi:hypothetical protein KAJ02_08125 [Candidatus Bipolaricaulota bacterium]|nr:hypothetical protein [Candidatus Bipolaricaulota bacterium]
MNQLTIETIDQVIEWITINKLDRLDLKNIRFVDPYALLILRLMILERKETGKPIEVAWPQAAAVNRWMMTMGIVAGNSPSSSNSQNSTPSSKGFESTLQPITRIENESGIGRVVDGFHHRLEERYPLTESSRRALVAVMIELFQNIPHHSNANGTVADPHGIAAMQDYEDSIFLAVADKGIGLSASLGLRDGYQGLSDAGAVDVVFHQGASRFDDPGRGGELRRIADLIRSWDGVFALRTGRALYYFDSRGGDVYDVPAFPGVQLGLRLPRRVLI